MAEPIPVQGLFETHLTVSNLQRSIKFYQDIVGLQLALEVLTYLSSFAKWTTV
jgi:catechol 2,3-dioxygenase-like lactoylglutathione lyase family enzyme